MLNQSADVVALGTPNGASEVGVGIGSAQPHGARRYRHHHNRSRTGCDLPQGDCPLFLNFRVRRKILKWKDVARRQEDYAVGGRAADQLAVGLNHGDQFVRSFVVADNQDQRNACGLLQLRNQQRFGRGVEPGDTEPPRVGSQEGGNTRKRGQFFDVRK